MPPEGNAMGHTEQECHQEKVPGVAMGNSANRAQCQRYDRQKCHRETVPGVMMGKSVTKR